MNETHLNGDSYSVVKLDGEECNDVKIETIKEWYFNRQINDSSLIFSTQVGKWTMLKKIFDVEHLKAEFYQGNQQTTIHNESPIDSFQDPSPTQFNQTPETQFYQQQQVTPNQDNQQYTNPEFSNQNQTGPESQNTPNDFNQSPPNYGNQAGFNDAQPNANYGYQANSNSTAQAANTFLKPVKAYRQASVFLLTNFVFWVISTALLIYYEIDKSSAKSANDFSYNLGQAVGKDIIKLLIDFALATSLWNAVSTDTKARIFTIIRSYLGFIVNMVWIIPLFATGFYFAGASSSASVFFYVFGLLILLHGKEIPSKGRRQVGWACFFLFIITTCVSIYSIKPILSVSSENQGALSELKKHEIDSNEFIDDQNKVKVVLPNGWQQYATTFPGVEAENVKMIALNQEKSRGANFYISYFPQNLDDVNAYQTNTLNEIVENMETILRRQHKSYKTLSSSPISISGKLGKRIIYQRTNPKTSKDQIGHMILAIDNQASYMLEVWCEKDDYTAASGDFIFFESNFTLLNPE